MSKKGKQKASAEAPEEFPEDLPVLPARDIVAYPSVMLSLYVGRAASVDAVQVAVEQGRQILVVSQKDEGIEEPNAADLYEFGVIGNIIRTLQLPDGRHKVLLQGLARARVVRFIETGGRLHAEIEALPEDEEVELEEEEREIITRIRRNLQLLVEHEHLPEEILLVTEEIDSPNVLCDVILAHYKLPVAEAQAILEELDPVKRIHTTDRIIADDVNQLRVGESIEDRARDEMARGQREYYLREQLKLIQRELGEVADESEDLGELKQSLESAKLPREARQEADKQLKRLERMPLESSEYALLRTYLEWLADLPWSKRTKDRLDLDVAKEILDEDHYGLDKVKERILEYLGVRKLKRDSKGPILCFVGPPGVGKTSLAISIARALNRKHVRMSLGGVRDEAEIRGHRRTYVGALPGRIVQGLKQLGSRNGVFILDELDKVGADFRGDPASALLEVLDPQQNKEFRDHYLLVSFDLSQTMFIATANTIDTVPRALLDRLEVISIPGYTTEEKIAIAQKYLIPRQMDENGLVEVALKFQRSALLFLIENYTREAGVRNLEREIAALCRKVARAYAEDKKVPKSITPQLVRRFLGVPKFEPEMNETPNVPGLALGLAWTIDGGEVMPVEASVAKGKGALTLTGQLGEVMRESAQAAVFYARAHAKDLGLDSNFHEKVDVHIHVPGGATPKDGPSAGVTIALALVSALTGRRVCRDIAMTGEITLSGAVLPVGGLKEKSLAALRQGIKRVVIPASNVKDLEEVPIEQRRQLEFIPVKEVGEVVSVALELTSEGLARGSRRDKRQASLRAEC